MNLEHLALWLLPIVVIIVVAVVVRNMRHRAARARAAIAIPATQDDESYLDSSHISGPIAGLAERKPKE